MKKRLDKAKGNWLEELTHILYAYRITPRATTGEISFSLVYGAEELIPMEVQVSNFRTQYAESSEDPEKMQFNLD